MRLSPDEVMAAYRCVHLACQGFKPGCYPHGLAAFRDRLEVEVRRLATCEISAGGHRSAETTCVQPSSEQWLTSRETAELLGVTARQVRRLTAELGARQFDGRWMFDYSKVVECREVRRNG